MLNSLIMFKMLSHGFGRFINGLALITILLNWSPISINLVVFKLQLQTLVIIMIIRDIFVTLNFEMIPVFGSVQPSRRVSIITIIFIVM